MILLFFLKFYNSLILIYIVTLFLVKLSILNINHHFIRFLVARLGSVIEPALNVIRKFLPPVGNFDFSPIFLCFFIEVLVRFLR